MPLGASANGAALPHAFCCTRRRWYFTESKRRLTVQFYTPLFEHKPSPVVSHKFVLSALVMVGLAVGSWSAFAAEESAADWVGYVVVRVILAIVVILAVAGAVAYAGLALAKIINAAAWVVRRFKR